MTRLSILIPSRAEKLLYPTIDDLLRKCAGDFEIIVNVDEPSVGSEVVDSRVRYLRQPKPVGMRAGIRAAAALATGDYLMKLDAHCLVDQAFDLKMLEPMQPHWVMVPRRHKLDAENWVVIPPNAENPPIDYEYFIFPLKYRPASLHGFRWRERGLARAEQRVDDTLTFQGSCWLMSRDHFDEHGFFLDEGYNGIPKQEAEEIGLTTWTTGGRVMVNKGTWCAHLHKTVTAGYDRNRQEIDECYAYSYNHWVIERRAAFKTVIERFWPLPGWPADWGRRLYG